jgi:serine/threonine protein phosphatase PrpC
MDNEYVAKLVLNHPKTSFLQIAKTLCSEAIILGSADNVTAMVIDIK